MFLSGCYRSVAEFSLKRQWCSSGTVAKCSIQYCLA